MQSWRPQHSDQGNLHVRGAEPWAEISNGTEGKFKSALEAFSLNLTQVKVLSGIDLVHTHTGYVSMAWFPRKNLYGVPCVLTTHSFKPLRAWKTEQLGSGYASDPVSHRPRRIPTFPGNRTLRLKLSVFLVNKAELSRQSEFVHFAALGNNLHEGYQGGGG